MDLNPRQIRILDVVRLRGAQSVESLSEELNVTLQTVRRDVQRLADAKVLTRFHGGVRLPNSTIENIARTARQTLHAPGKGRIAEVIASCIPNHCSLILNIGTSTEAVASALLHHQGLRVITYNLNVADILCKNEDSEIIIAGGVVRPRDGGIVGEAAVDFIKQFKVDIAVIGISGIETDGTLRDFDYREVRVAQTILAHAREVWLAADVSKFSRPAMVEVGTLAQIHRLFTDESPPVAFQALLDDAGVDVTVCA